MKKNRIIALYGAGRGPTVSTREFTAPTVRVLQLEEGDQVAISGFPDDSVMVIERNGDHPVPPAMSLQISCVGQKSKKLMCFIVEA